MKRNTLIAGAALVAVALTSAAVYAKEGGHRDGRGQGRIEAMLERFDLNDDGAITMAEIEAAGAERFNEADTNSDDLLTAEEMLAAAQKDVTERMSDRISKRISNSDENGDGMLSLEEAVDARSPRIEHMFEHLDTDSDGVVTQAELEAAKSKFRRGKRGHRNADDG